MQDIQDTIEQIRKLLDYMERMAKAAERDMDTQMRSSRIGWENWYRAVVMLSKYDQKREATQKVEEGEPPCDWEI